MKKQNGVSLIELLVVVAILGIIAAVALPSYQEQTRATHRTDAAAVLIKASVLMERHYASNSYSYAGATAGTTVPAKSPVDGADTKYQIQVSNLSATTYTLSAVPQGGQASDTCGTLTLDQTGAKDSAGTVDDCWR